MAASRLDTDRTQRLRRAKLVGIPEPVPESPESHFDLFSKQGFSAARREWLGDAPKHPFRAKPASLARLRRRHGVCPLPVLAGQSSLRHELYNFLKRQIILMVPNRVASRVAVGLERS